MRSLFFKLPDIFRILIFILFLNNLWVIKNLSSEYQGFSNSEYVILLALPYSIIQIQFVYIQSKNMV